MPAVLFTLGVVNFLMAGWLVSLTVETVARGDVGRGLLLLLVAALNVLTGSNCWRVRRKISRREQP